MQSDQNLHCFQAQFTNDEELIDRTKKANQTVQVFRLILVLAVWACHIVGFAGACYIHPNIWTDLPLLFNA